MSVPIEAGRSGPRAHGGHIAGAKYPPRVLTATETSLPVKTIGSMTCESCGYPTAGSVLQW